MGLRLHGDSVVARVSARTGGFTLPATAEITYCVQYGSNGCGDNNGVTSCARSTYRGAPNENEPDWVTRLPASAYRASDLCPSPATVVLKVKDVTPEEFDKTTVTPDPGELIDPEILKLLRSDEQTDLPPASGVLYRPDPSFDDITSPPTPPQTALPLWCYPGITHIGPELFFNTYGTVKWTAELWVQAMYHAYWDPEIYNPSDVTWGHAGVTGDRRISSAANTVLVNLALQNKDWDGEDVNPGWPGLDTLVATVTVTVLGNTTFVLNNADELVEELLARFYEVARQAHWDGPEPWNGLVTSDYKRYLGQIEWDHQPFLPPGRRLVSTGREAEERTCLGTDLQIVRASGAHPGPFHDPRFVDPLDPDYDLIPAVWPHGLCGIGDNPNVPADDPEGSKWAYFDLQCPVESRSNLDPADPRTLHPSPADLWVEWFKLPDPAEPDYLDVLRKPWTLGEAWEEALEDPRIRCADESCGNWAPPIAGFYLVRFRIDKPTDRPLPDDPLTGEGEYVTEWHEAWLRARHGVDVAVTDCWDKLDQADEPSDCARPTTDDRLPLQFDDLVWVSPLGLTGLR